MADIGCGCTMLSPCARPATQEDLLCDECRAFTGGGHATLTGGGPHINFPMGAVVGFESVTRA